MNFPMAEAFTRILPGLVRLVLPQGVFDIDGNIPPSDLTLLATTNRLLIRDDLHPAIVQLLLQTVMQVHGGQDIFQRAGEFPTSVDAEYPMAASAIDYYNNGPSFLQRHLPVWLTVHVQRAIAVLVTAIAVGIPFLNLAPKLFKSLVEYRLGAMYRRLRNIEAGLHKETVSVPELSAFEAELASIDSKISMLGVPMKHSDLFFSIKSHLDVVRIRLGLRRGELFRPATQQA
jgi:hypothetical protein